MYFRSFKIQFDEDEKAKGYGCRPDVEYEVLAISACHIPSASSAGGLPGAPQQTYLLIKNDKNKLKWISESIISVPRIE